MEGNTTARLDEYARTHPGTDISRVGGIWRAWIPSNWDPRAGQMAHGRDAGELLAKLSAAGG
jgi:hypothetical protein